VGVAEAADQGVVGFAGFGEGVVAAVEVLALLQLGLQQVFFGRQFAVEAEEFLLFFGEGADVDFVLLVGVHCCGSVVCIGCLPGGGLVVDGAFGLSSRRRWV